MIEMKGGLVNRVDFDNHRGVIIKQFASENGIYKAIGERKEAEIYAMEHIAIAPKYLGEQNGHVLMSFVQGEKELDEAVRVIPEAVRQKVFYTAGETLSAIHHVEFHALPLHYHQQHYAHVCEILAKTKTRLLRVGLSPIQILDTLVDTYDAREIEKQGLVWTHGDYWLNNIVGELKRDRFILNGVIDWELSGRHSPYVDFAIVKLSIEDMHDDSSTAFWKGYGRKPQSRLQTHFAILKTLEWIHGEEQGNLLDSDFYQKKLQMIKNEL